MTSLRTLVIASTFLVACNGATESSGDGSSQSPGANGTPAAPGATSQEAEGDEDLPSPAFCSGQSGYDSVSESIFHALAPEPAASYLALRRNAGTVPSPGLTKDLITVAERGAQCAGASDAVACQDAYTKLDPPISVSLHTCFTRGDSVGCLETKAEAMAFLSKVHSVEEAFFVIQYDGYYADCVHSEVLAKGKQLADGSFRLSVAKGGGCQDIYRAELLVKPDGTITELSSVKTDLELGCP